MESTFVQINKRSLALNLLVLGQLIVILGHEHDDGFDEMRAWWHGLFACILREVRIGMAVLHF